MEFWEKKAGNVQEGGTTRRPGEEEPLPGERLVIKKKTASEAEQSIAAETRAYEEREIAHLKTKLQELGLSAAEALRSPEKMEAVRKVLSPKFRDIKLGEHLLTVRNEEFEADRRRHTAQS